MKKDSKEERIEKGERGGEYDGDKSGDDYAGDEDCIVFLSTTHVVL